MAERQAGSGEDTTSGPPRLGKRKPTAPPTEEELERRKKRAMRAAINGALRPVKEGEQRVIGRVEKIDCAKRPIVFHIASGEDKFSVTSADFAGIDMNTFDGAASGVSVGCDSEISGLNIVITYLASTGAGGSRGTLRSLEFVPDGFGFGPTDEDPGLDAEPTARKPDENERSAMLQAIKNEIRTPAAGEKRQMGYLEKIECSDRAFVFNFRTDTGVVRLLNTDPQLLQIRLFTRDLGTFQFGCTSKPLDVPVVFIYSDKPDAKRKTNGEIVTLDVVPKDFTLE